eukprot:COSAG02_NODE_20756_length_816_cov_13.518033_2_plen_194_part_01
MSNRNGEKCLRMPVLMPSAGRYQPSGTAGKQALLDISDMMLSQSRAPATRYLQIVAVKRSEIEGYKEQFPEHTFLELPEICDKLGIGASRYYMKQLAHILVDESFPYCVVLDDNIVFWKGVTLRNDPFEQFGTKSCADKCLFSDVSMWDVLQHFQVNLQSLERTSEQIAVYGFHKYQPQRTKFSSAYARKHVCS